MNNKTNKELLKELKKLQVENNSLKNLYHKNITKRIQDEEKLKNSYDFTQTLINTIPSPMKVTDETGTVLFLCDILTSHFGENAIGKKCWELFRVDRKQCSDCPVIKGITLGKTECFESHQVLGNRIFEITHTEMMLEGEKANFGIYHDITERKQAEETLFKSEEYLKRIISSSNDCIKVLDLEGNLLSMSTGGQKLLDIEDISIYLNKSWVDFWKGKDKEGALEAISKAKKGDSGLFIGYSPTEKGTPKWWEIIITPIKDSNDNIYRLLAISRDITERKQVESRLRGLNSIIENSLNEIYISSLINS